jgi:hypothetical protein
VPKIVNANILEAGARSHTLPERLEVREPCARFRPDDHPGISRHAFHPFQNVNRGMTKMYDLGAGL